MLDYVFDLILKLSSIQDEDTKSEQDEDGKSKFKRRPRPEPLIIPPHKPSTFIPPSLYSTISSYQSNLRSPVRLPEHPAALPPYTPPPILSPMREGSGLYCSTFLANIASNQSLPPPLPPPPTPKSATRSLLRSGKLCNVMLQPMYIQKEVAYFLNQEIGKILKLQGLMQKHSGYFVST